MSDVVSFRRPPSARDTTSFVGMAIFLGGWTMTFAALFFAYFDVRLSSTMWPPMGEAAAPALLPAINTGVILLSSVTLQLGLWAVRGARPVGLKRALFATLVLGALFLSLQMISWRSLWLSGIRPDTGRYGSVLFMLTCFHGLHVFVGLIGLALVFVGALRGRYHTARHAPVRNWTLYWHFVDAIWVLMFLTVYVF